MDANLRGGEVLSRGVSLQHLRDRRRRRRAHARRRIRHHQSQRRRRRGPREELPGGRREEFRPVRVQASRIRARQRRHAQRRVGAHAGRSEPIAVPGLPAKTLRVARVGIGRTDRRRTGERLRAARVRRHVPAPRRTHRRRVVRRRGGFPVRSRRDAVRETSSQMRDERGDGRLGPGRAFRRGAQLRAPRRRREIPAGARILGKRTTSRTVRDAIERRHHSVARGGVRGGGDRSRGRTAHQRAERAERVARHVARRVSDARERRREERVHLGGWRVVAALLEDVRESLQGVVDAGGGCVRVREAGSVIRGERGDDFGVERDLSGGEEVAEEGVESLAEGSPRGGVRGAVHGAHEEQDVGGDVARGGVADGGETRPDPAAVVEEVSDRDAERVGAVDALGGGGLDRTDRVAPRLAATAGSRRERSTRLAAAATGGRAGRGAIVAPAAHGAVVQKVPLRRAREKTTREGGSRGRQRADDARAPSKTTRGGDGRGRASVLPPRRGRRARGSEVPL